MPNNTQYDDEINLMDYIKVIIKRKKIIISTFLICVIAAVIYSFIVPPVYRLTQMLKLPTVGMDEYLYAPELIKDQIEEGFYNYKIFSSPNYNNKYNINDINFIKVEIPKHKQFLKLYANTTQRDSKNKKEIFKELFNQLAKEYSSKLDVRLEDINKNLLIKNNQIKEINADIDIMKSGLVLLDSRINSVNGKLELAKCNTEGISLEQKKFLEKEAASDGASLFFFLYATTAQQSILYFDQLDRELVSLKEERLSKDNKIQDLLRKKEVHNIEIFALAKKKEFVNNIEELCPCLLSTNPIKPKKRRMIVVSAMVGLILGVFIAFFVEFWQNSKENRQ